MMVERARGLFESDARYALRMLPDKEKRISELVAEVTRLRAVIDALTTPGAQLSELRRAHEAFLAEARVASLRFGGPE